MEPVGWSSLSPELVNRVADVFLATSDVDYYMSLRAVCSNWRTSTDAPLGLDYRFRPHRWVMLKVKSRAGKDDAFGQCLFLNVDTGRLLWKDLPMLRSYTRVVSTTDGLLVLETTPIDNGSYAICVLNPFTGHLVRVPKTGMCDRNFGGNAFFAAGSSPTLYTFLDARPFASINPTSGLTFRFTADTETGIRQYTSVATFRSRAYAVDGTGTVVVLGDPHQPGQRADITAVVTVDNGKEHRPLLVDNGGELLLVRRWASDEHGVEFFRVDVENRGLETIKGIGSRAIFLAHGWCLSLDANNFPAVEGNCIYDFLSGGRTNIHIHHLTDGRVEIVSVYVPIPLASVSEDPFSYAQLRRIRPLSIVEFVLRKCRKLCTGTHTCIK